MVNSENIKFFLFPMKNKIYAEILSTSLIGKPIILKSLSEFIFFLTFEVLDIKLISRFMGYPKNYSLQKMSGN
jgi:hypothetical protein